MKRLLLSLLCFLSIAVPGIAQSPTDLNEGFRVGHSTSTGAFTLSWWGRTGRNYFVQQTDDLHVWNYLPIMETGADEVIQWGFTTNAIKSFFRLQFDLDQDGLPDSWENTYYGSNHGLMDPNALSARGDGLTNLQTCFLGLNPLDQYNSVVNPVKPTVTLAATPSVTFAPGSTVLSATATQLSGTIARVDFYQDWGYRGTAIPTSSTNSYICTSALSGLVAGNYQMTAIAVDTAGISSTPTSITVTVNPPPVTTDPNRYSRGIGSNQTYLSSVIALDSQKGIILEGPNAVFNYPNGIPWYLRLQAEPASPWWHIYDTGAGLAYYQFNGPVVLGAQTIGANPPLVAFGSQGGGSALYANQSYNFGVVPGGRYPGLINDIRVEVYEKSRFDNGANNVAPITSGTFFFTLPQVTDTTAWNQFAANGYVKDCQVTGTLNNKPFNFLTRVQFMAGSRQSTTWGWGQYKPYGLLVTHKSSSTDFVYKVSYKGVTELMPNDYLMAIDGSGNQVYNLTYSLDFDTLPPWQSTYITQPHFEGIPLPSAYQGKTVDELIHNAPAVSGTLTVSGTSLTAVDNSPELRSHPVLDNFVSDMGGDPMAIANYVLNEIDLTDAMGYGAISGTTVLLNDKSINPTGVSRNAMATFMESQGSPTEQCALLVYLLRKCKDPTTGQPVPCGYIFPQQNGTLMFDKQLSKLLRIQLRGAQGNTGASENVPQLIPVNYPWVAAYIGGKWVHIFPWLKDTAVEEGYDLWNYMAPVVTTTGTTSGYASAGQWLRNYLLMSQGIRSLSTEDNPGTLFPLWINKQLQTNYPNVSIDDIGISYTNRRNYFTRWEDFPRPWQTPVISDSNFAKNLDYTQNPGLTSTSLQNIFDTISVSVAKVATSSTTQILTTGTLRLTDLHDRRFMLYHKSLGSNQYQVYLSLEAFSPSATGTNNFSNGPGDLLNKQVTSATLQAADDALQLNINYNRHRQLPSSFTQPEQWTPFLGFYEALTITDSRPLRKGDMAALCLNYGRVTAKMQEYQAEKYWQYQQLLSGTNPPSVADPEQSTGALLHIMGLSYYYKSTKFQQEVEDWTKTHAISWNAHGLAKFSPERDSTGAIKLTTGGDINLQYPNVDMSFLRAAIAGNGTSHLDTGNTEDIANGAMELMIGELSAQEHRVLNQFFQLNASVSTVKLLDLAQGAVPGSRIVELNANNYLAMSGSNFTVAKTGTAGTTTKTLSQWAGTDLWKSITDALTDTNYGPLTTVFVTPGPQVATGQSGKPYTGMGAFIIGNGKYAALISGDTLINGGFAPSIHFSINSYYPTTNYVTHSNLFPTYDGGFSLFNSTTTTSSVFTSTPTIWSNSSFDSFSSSVSNFSLSITEDRFNALTWFSSITNTTPPTTYAGTQTSSANLLMTNFGTAGQVSDYRNFTSSSGFNATSNGIFASVTSVADPVSVLTGEFYVDAVDLKLDGPMPLVIRRNYSSLNKADNNFGQGWRMSCFPYLAFSSTDSTVSPTLISAPEMDGSVIMYRRNAAPNQNTWTPQPKDNPTLANVAQGVPGGLGNVYNNQLVQSGTDQFLLNGADGSVRTYKVQSFVSGTAGLTRTRPYLQTWKDSRGNSLAFTSGTDSKATDYGQIKRIQASNGNFVGFYYDTFGHITEAYTGDGRRLYYSYDSYGDLTDVTLPDASVLHYDYEHLSSSTLPSAGLKAEYFSGEDLNNSVLVRNDATVNFPWGTGSPDSKVPSESFSVRWTGQVIPQFTETYTFSTMTDDGARLWVNNQLIVDNWNYVPVLTEKTGIPINLVAGQKYDIRLEYYERSGGAYAYLYWSSPRQAHQIIPQSALCPPKAPLYSSHLLKQEVKPGGRVIQNNYDSSGRVVSQYATVGTDLTPVLSGSFSYTVSGTNADDKSVSGTTVFTDGLGRATTYVYTNSQITSITDPSQIPVSQEWYGWNETTNGAYPRSLKSRTDKRGLVTTYKYDSRGNPVEVSVTGDLTGDPAASSTTATTYTGYNSLNLVTSSTNATGNVTTYGYGTVPGQLYLPTSITKSNTGGIISSGTFTYEDVPSGTVPDGAPKAYGVLKHEIIGLPDGAETNYTHNANGFITSITKPTGTTDPAEVINYRYNLRGELAAETDALGRITSYAYDGRGNRMWMERHDEAGKLVAWQYNYYNQNGEIEWTQGPRYTPDDYVLKRYDGAGRLSEETKWRSEASADNSGVQAPESTDAAYATAFRFYNRSGDVTEIRDVRRNSTEMGYNSLGQMTSRKFHEGGLTGPVKAQETFGYEPGGEINYYKKYVDIAGNTFSETSKAYTATGKPKEQHNPDGTVLYWQYDLLGRVVKEIRGNNNPIQNNYWETSYDDFNRTVTRKLKKPDGSVLANEISCFDRRGNLLSKTDLQGNTFSTAYDALNRVKSTAGPATDSTTTQETTFHTYGVGGKVHIVSDALKQNTYTLNDAVGRPLLIQVKDRANNVVRQTSYTYSPDFNSVTTTEGTGTSAVRATTFTDTYGKPVLVMNADGTFKRFEYDNAGNLLKSRDEDGNVTVNTYDALNRLATETLPGGAATTFIYDNAGNVRQRQMPGNQVYWQEFDNASRKTKEYLVGSNGLTSGTTRIFNYTYYPAGHNWAGLPQTTTDPRGVAVTTTYDDLVRPSVVTTVGAQDAQNQVTTYGFDWMGRMTSLEQHYSQNGGGFTSGTSTLIQRTYDGYGHIKTEQVSIDGVPMNKFSQSWDGAGKRASLLSNLIAQGNGAGLMTAYDYRADGLLKEQRVARGYYSTIAHYDESQQQPHIPTDPSDPSIHNFNYDSSGLLLSRVNAWRIQTITGRDSRGRTLTQQNTLQDNTVPLSESQDWLGTDKRWAYTATRSGTTALGTTAWNETRYYNYNGRGQMYYESDAPSANGYADYLHRFDMEGTPDGAGLGVHTLAMRRLSTNGSNFEAGSWAVSNFVNQDSAVDSFRRPNYEGQALAQDAFSSGTCSYDSAGNTTVRTYWSPDGSLNPTQYLTWDAQGRLVNVYQLDPSGVGFNWSAVYDALGRRLRTTKQDLAWNSGGQYWYYTGYGQNFDSYYDPQVEFLELGVNATPIVSGTSGTSTRTWKIFGPDLNGRYGALQGIGGLEATIDEATSTVTPVITDAFGNVVGAVHTYTTPFDEETGEGGIMTIWITWSDARPGSYGVLPGSTVPVLGGTNVTLDQACLWRGYRIDPTGLYYLGARYYEPTSGRFISPDPLGHAASMSLYDYCAGDSVNALDPTGRCLSSFKGGENTPYAGSGNALAGFNSSYPSASWNQMDTAYAKSQALGNISDTQRLLIVGENVGAFAGNVLSGNQWSQPANDQSVTAKQMFYQWVNGTGSDNRTFNENSVMGKQMLNANYTQAAMQQAAQQAVNGNYAVAKINRSLADENQLYYPVDFMLDAFGGQNNPARAFQGSIRGGVWAGTPVYNNGYYTVPMVVLLKDTMNAASGVRPPPSFGGYNPSGAMPENPYGPNGPMRTIEVNYKLNTNTVIFP